MTSPYWAKLWIEILDDPKVAAMPDWLFRRFIYFVLAAKEYNHDGLLQPVEALAWRIRISAQEATDALSALGKVGVARETEDGWLLVNFAKRQFASPGAERVRRYREKKRNECNVTVKTPEAEAEVDTDTDTEAEKNAWATTPLRKFYETKDIIRLIADSTTQVAIPSGQLERIEQIIALLDSYGYEAVKSAFAGAYKRWCSTKGKSGRHYSGTNFGWVDWAQDALSNNGAGGFASVTEADVRKMTQGEYIDYMTWKAAQSA